eukprot:TRINITY_DN15439_c0_g1_i1.p1 TRINITY_DN15439_c0_g1~~TRINITY_DN15439_c0_g1_i1.p1  ORF type:complete len:256 (-),score=35.31 TRINITY_DN15439_c0_g1_i1:629-1396(-)
MEHETVDPVVIDLECDDDETIRLKAQEGLAAPAPLFALRNYGFEDLIHKVRDATRSRDQLDGFSGHDKCVSCELTDKLAATLKQRCREVAGRLCDAVLGEEFLAELDRTGRTIDGRQSLRYYPGGDGTGDIALGPHVDNTLFTMLWADGPGFQVVTTHEAAESSSGLGLPSIGPSFPQGVSEDKWAEVAQFWSEDLLLVTVGQEWIDVGAESHNEMMLRVKRAALHRVALPKSPRHSLPFLVRIVSQAESEANNW